MIVVVTIFADPALLKRIRFQAICYIFNRPSGARCHRFVPVQSSAAASPAARSNSRGASDLLRGGVCGLRNQLSHRPLPRHLPQKLVTRFRELGQSERFAEYFLIGTLLSLIATVFGGIVLLKF